MKRIVDPELRALKRAARLLAPFDLLTKRRMLWWLVWREGGLPFQTGRQVADLITSAPTAELPS